MSAQLLGPISPPEGVEPNFIDPPSRLERNIVLHAICLTLVTVLVSMRVYTRIQIMKAKLGIDDYFCVLSYFLTLTFSSLMFKDYSKGVGRHVWDTPPEWIVDALKYFTIAFLVYLVLAACIKLTFLFFYYRLLSPHSKARYFISCGVIFVVCTSLALCLATICNCTPVERVWDPAVPGKCFDPMTLFYTSGAFGAATDIYVLILPVAPLWQLNMDLRRKLRILAVFGIGIFACVASLFRLAKTHYLDANYDATWNMSDIIHWQTIEVNTGIVCSCLVFLPAFLNRHRPKSIESLISRLRPHAPISADIEEGGNSPGKKQGPRLGHQQKVTSESEDLLISKRRTNSNAQEPESQRISSTYDVTGGNNWLDI